MRKIYIIVGLLVAITLAVVMFGSRYGMKVGNVIIAPDSDKKILEDLNHSFWEDIQFKDFARAATYHTDLVQAEHDIPFYIERLFLVKPENLDIREIEIVEVDIDSTGNRGRARTKLLMDVLNTKRVEEPEAVLYWFKENGEWKLNLESSLRKLEEDKSKKKKKR